MSSKRSAHHRPSSLGPRPAANAAAHDRPTPRVSPPAPPSTDRRRGFLAGGALVIAVLLVGVGWVIASGNGGSGSAAAQGTVIQGNGGHWTNISVGQLDTMLKAKDFTFLNVKTPYIGEIEGTDLYIPFTDLAARKAELPADKAAKIVVYCRSGNESAVASQTLLDLGYTDILNLDGGMNAWTAAGHQIVQKPRT